MVESIDVLFSQNRKVRQEFGGNEEKIYNLKEFKKAPIKMVYDTFYGISTVKDLQTKLQTIVAYK